jgi:hypothetical protein
MCTAISRIAIQTTLELPFVVTAGMVICDKNRLYESCGVILQKTGERGKTEAEHLKPLVGRISLAGKGEGGFAWFFHRYRHK